MFATIADFEGWAGRCWLFGSVNSETKKDYLPACGPFWGRISVRAVELFAGAGGLALGVSNAGFTHQAVVEMDKDCCRTIRQNQTNKIRPVVDWPLHELNVRHFDYSTVTGKVDLLAAGPPCQPFSMAGKCIGLEDSRNMFPEVARALRRLHPLAFLVENVRGILRPSFNAGLEYVLLMLRYPELEIRGDETWMEHAQRLTDHHCK